MKRTVDTQCDLPEMVATVQLLLAALAERVRLEGQPSELHAELALAAQHTCTALGLLL